jgi:hypothetical protein
MKEPSLTKRSVLRLSTLGLLDGLGDTVSRIAESLRNQGVTGEPSSSRDCVVARYLDAVIGADPAVDRVIVLRERVEVRMRKRLQPRVFVRTPPPIENFIRAFDANAFPELLTRDVTPTSTPVADQHC